MTDRTKAGAPGRAMWWAVGGAAALVIAGAGAFWVAARARTPAALDGAVAVRVTGSACEPMALTVPAGRTRFVVRNDSDRPLEWEILDGVMVDEDLLPEQVMLLGFSQGAMMALHVAPRREEAVAGVTAIAGRLLVPESLVDEAVSRPPVLLVHGDLDDVVPIEALPEATRALEEAGWSEVYAHVMKGTGHGIAPDGLSVALAFMRDRLGMS